MTPELESLSEQLAAFLASLEMGARNMLLPSRLTQLAILVVLLLATWLIQRWAVPALRAWLRRREGWPMWRIRAGVVVQRRLPLMIFVTLAWMATWAMQAVTVFPSRSYLLELVATIATALVAVAFASRLVRNPILRKVVRWGLWGFVVVYYTGVVDEAARALDSLAFQMGEFRLSALTLMQALIVTGVLFTGARMVARVGAENIRRNEEISPSMRVLAVKILQIALYGLALFIGLKAVGVDLTGLAVLSGAIGVGLGFGLQKVVSNLVSGVIILLDKSIKPGDVISLGETFGWINTLGARYASITTRDGKEYLIPNEDLITGQVVNWSHSDKFVRLDIYFGTAYHDDPHMVRRIAIEAASGVRRVLADPNPVCHIVGFGDSSVDYILRFWITDPTGGLTNIRGNVYLALWDAFQANGVTIPFPQREVKVLGGSELGTRAVED
ncbi:Mechanosensitive ion channel [Tranquillimonas rosea]|uniref:Mechanosensitive ion channel n=1 Tax=Tranquillimonas rosea TaxID=641238 RepID=A0A1H9U9I1_9RHOB|nr:Mechanosensitive ion channel [Tranquillimonas rosea]